MKKEIKEILCGGCLISGIAIAIAFLLVTANVGNVGNQPTVEQRTWKEIDMLVTGNDPGAGNYGWLNLSVVKLNHFDYSANLTNNESCFCYTTVNNTHAGTQEMDGVAIEIAMQFRLNTSFRETNNTWMLGYLHVYCNCASLSISDELCTLYNVTADATYLYGYAVVDNSGSGYTLTDAQNVTSCTFNATGYLL